MADIEKVARALGVASRKTGLFGGGEINRLRAENERLRAALKECADVLGSEAVQDVFRFASAHGHKYEGPSVDLVAIRALLGESQ